MKGIARIVGLTLCLTVLILFVGYAAVSNRQKPRAGGARPPDSAKSTSQATAEEMRMVRQWWSENEPDPRSIEEISWRVGEMKAKGFRGNRMICAKIRHENQLGGKSVVEQLFMHSANGAFRYMDPGGIDSFWYRAGFEAATK